MTAKDMLARLHQIGNAYYGEEKWEVQQDTIATWISKGRAPVAALMTAEEIQTVCWIMELKTAWRSRITDDEWKAMLGSIRLVDIAKITEKQFYQLGWLIECQVLRNELGWTQEEWEYLSELIGIVDMSALDITTAKRLQSGLLTDLEEIRESIAMEAAERGQL